MNAIGVVVPTFNDAQYLRSGISSLMSQSVPPAEVIVVDDGSNSEVALDALADHRRDFPSVRFIRQNNSGPSVARNRGLFEVGAPLISFLDADDWLRGDCLERRLDHFSRTPDLAGAFGGWQAFSNERQGDRSQFSAMPPSALQRDGIGRRFPGGLPLWLMRTEVVRKAGGCDPALRHMEDFDLLLRMGRIGGRYAGDNEPTYVRMLRPGSLSRTSAGATYRGTMVFIRKAARERYFSRGEFARRLFLTHAQALWRLRLWRGPRARNSKTPS